MLHIDRQSAAITGNLKPRDQPQDIGVGKVLEIHVLMHIAFAIPWKLTTRNNAFLRRYSFRWYTANIKCRVTTNSTVFTGLLISAINNLALSQSRSSG